MITPDHIEETTSKPIQLDVTHIDLAAVTDDMDAQFVIMRLIEASGLILDVPIARNQAIAFGESLSSYASADHMPHWM
jgi:hypothetical protein